MAALVHRDFGVEPPKRGVGFEAIWAAMEAGTVPHMDSPTDVEGAGITVSAGASDVVG
jgi:hypothetical protein